MDHKPSGMAGQTSGKTDRAPSPERIARDVARLALVLGRQAAQERGRRRLTIRQVAEESGLGRATVHDLENGSIGSLASYTRLAYALRLKPQFDLAVGRPRDAEVGRARDPVHAAMGEAEAAQLRAHGLHVGLDEPFQHYQFAGRADVLAWSVDRAELLHIENKTRFPDLQECFGSFNAKRNYLGREFAAAAGVSRWHSETHVIAALWSSEVLKVLRMHRASFESVCPDHTDGFEAWWSGQPPGVGIRRILVLFDPMSGSRRDRRRWAGLAELPDLRPRYRNYAEAAAALGITR